MSNQFIGCVILVGDIQKGVSQSSGKEWAKQSFVVETVEQYPRRCSFDIMGEDNINKLAVKVSENVTVDFNIDAHMYNGRWYNSLTAWKVTRMGGTEQPTAAPTQTYQQTQQPAPIFPEPQKEEKLPF